MAKHNLNVIELGNSDRVETNDNGSDDNSRRLVTDGGNEDLEPFVSSETDEWSTPPEIWRPLSKAINGFDLDAASGAEKSPIAENVYTEDDDGTAQEWFGTVWVNPPYSNMGTWTGKVVSEIQRSDVDAILYLCKGDSSTNWWHQAIEEATAVCMLDSRISFGQEANSAPFASHLFVYGDVPPDVWDVLDDQGVVFTTANQHRISGQQKLIRDYI